MKLAFIALLIYVFSVLGNQGRSFKRVFDLAQKQLREVWGMELRELPVREKMTLHEKRQGKANFGTSRVSLTVCSNEEPVTAQGKLERLHPHIDITRSLPNRGDPPTVQDPKRRRRSHVFGLLYACHLNHLAQWRGTE